MLGFRRRLYRSRETIRKYLALTGGVVCAERLKNYVVATLGIWCSIPGAVEGDEVAAPIPGRELFLVVTHHCIRRPVGGIDCDGSDFVCAYGDGFAVAAVFRR